MKILRYLLQKEFIQILRNKSMWPIIFLMPIIQMVILVNAATLELKKSDVYVVDQDMSDASRQLVDKLKGNPFFQITSITDNDHLADQQLLNGKAGVVLDIPENFEKHLKRNNQASLQLRVDAINGLAAELTWSYMNSVIVDYNNQIRASWMGVSKFDPPQKIEVSQRYWYNPSLIYSFFMAPGVLVILVTLVGMFLAAVNLVREKEIGTMEQLNVTPIKKYQFIAAKMIPFLAIALLDLSFGLLIAKMVFNMPFEGSLLVLYGFTTVFLLGVLGLGLLISVVSETQQQVFFVSYFFLLVFILMSGLFTPVESMPTWAQWLDHLNPMYYMMKVIRNVVLKGSGFFDLKYEFLSMLGYGVAMFSLAVMRYRKTA
ncbi:ABC transporter permease [Prolixibacter denitrificans]|uniref:ABC-2 type transport system permease protein n=2 Tax=Prolixibacter denitrificans TaxID=1541063 RepID=A0A2P8CCS6_9BACT|nr:ABC transporter permease [Prolixibacter denitrificans]PSK82765.1 ABC-2 type transport system permease protein [Prolixibacter denitrificans]